jgi:MoxR-like ATPase
MREFKSDVEAADELYKSYEKLSEEIAKIVIGQNEVIKLVLTSIFCQGHSLLVGVPGLAKTLLIKTISEALHLTFNRIQFTPDLMPSDILGSETLDINRNFQFIKGPIFANIILADEINRTPPKTQAALLESMQEYSVTIAGEFHKLDRPFFVLATQNPIEQEGTYPLPEAQLDRFMFNILLDYPSFQHEIDIVKATTTSTTVNIDKVMGKDEILFYQQLIKKVPVTDNVIEYAVNLVHKTRPKTQNAADITNEYLEWGAGPRASQFLVTASKCNALLNGKYSPDISDVKEIAKPTLRHRILRNFKAEAEDVTVDNIIEELLE